jgi:hypothetical protein
MSAWQNTLVPPPPKDRADDETIAEGKVVFERAGCGSCHSGPAFTNHRIIAAPEIGTQPLRAKAMSNTEKAWDDTPRGYAFDQTYPFEEAPHTVVVPTSSLDESQIRLAYGFGDSPGGYKVPSLIGLAWTAPYLHDGGVAVGEDRARDLGAAGTILRQKRPHPDQSLLALIDRELRASVVDANRRDATLARMHVEGIGHEFWVDEKAGYSHDDQSALIAYLLDLRAE